MTKSDFQKHQFVAALGEHIILPVDIDPVKYAGSMLPPDAFDMHIDDRIIMPLVFFKTGKHIHGVMHYESPAQLFFIGYQCGKCDEIFLVPNSVTDHTTLAAAMRHKCTMSPNAQPKFDTRTRVLHIVQDIGRPGNLGSVGCEQYADAIMDVFGGGYIP